MRTYKKAKLKKSLENGGVSVCKFCKRPLSEDFFWEDIGHVFCNRACREKRLEILKKYADGRELNDKKEACAAILPEQRNYK